MIINGVELKDPDVSDVLFLERYEHEEDRLAEIATYVNDNISNLRRSQAIRKQCEGVFEFFDNVFGDGTAKAVFGESVNLSICLRAYGDVIEAINRLDVKSAQNIKSEFSKRFNNHVQHRKSNKKHNGNHKK